MSSSSGKVGADAFASIRPSTNPNFAERTSTMGAASSSNPPVPPPSSSPSYSMRVVQQETTTTTTAPPFSSGSSTTLPSRGGTTTTTFDFSGRRDDVFFHPPQHGSSTTSGPPGGIPSQFRVGEGDLRPTPQGMGGVGGVVGGGGNYVGSNHPAFQPRNGGGVSGGVAGGHSQPTHPSGARYLPMFTGDPGVGPQPPYGGGVPGPNGLFAGEPDPDHLPPFDLSRLQQPPNQLPRQFGGGPPSNNFYC